MKILSSRFNVTFGLIALLIISCDVKIIPAEESGQETSTTVEKFTNPLWDGADPFMVKHGDLYYYIESLGRDGIAVWKSQMMTERGTRRIVWTPTDTGWNTDEIWAPELHYLDGRWYIYYAADSGANRDHRMGVLESVTDDPQGEYIDKGMLYTGDYIESYSLNRWAIDGTVLSQDGALYFIWSGWESTHDNQYLYIAPMSNPWTISGNRVRLADNDDYIWERVGEDPGQRGLNEAPQVLKNGENVFVIYSCSGSWQTTYKLGMLRLDNGGNPLNPEHWTKASETVFQGTEEVYGVGHASYVKSPDGTEDWIIYHSKKETTPGWDRDVRMQPFTWNIDGTPNFGTPVVPGDSLAAPSGE